MSDIVPFRTFHVCFHIQYFFIPSALKYIMIYGHKEKKHSDFHSSKCFMKYKTIIELNH